jgi:hypothetical protein
MINNATNIVFDNTYFDCRVRGDNLPEEDVYGTEEILVILYGGWRVYTRMSHVVRFVPI